MAYQMEFDFGEEHAPEHQCVRRPPAIDRLSDMMVDSDVPPLVISRLIAGEIVSAMRSMVHEGKGWRRVPQRDLMNRIKGCRELHRHLMHSERSSPRDQLDLDGMQFRFVFDRIVELFKTALNDAGVQIEGNGERLQLELGKYENTEATGARTLPPTTAGLKHFQNQ
jgi:hypothetical protein